MLKIMTILLKLTLVLFAIFLIFNTIEKETEPQPEMEAKTREQAQKYLDTVFQDMPFVIYEITFDRTHAFYDYAAMVRNEENNIEFRVYLDNHTGKMDDDYVEMKWKDDITDDMLPFIKEYFGKEVTLYVAYEVFDDEHIDPNNPGDYKDYDGRPYISVLVQHPKRADERDKAELINFLKKECGLKHAQVQVSYYKNGELLMDDGWYKEF